MKRFSIAVATEGNTDVVNLQAELSRRVSDFTEDGLLHLFVAGSTAALTTLEFEPGLVKHDMPEMFQQLEKLIDNTPHGREKVAKVREMMKAMMAQRQSAKAQQA